MDRLHLQKGRYLVRIARGKADLARARDLRALCFGGQEQDSFDATCTHVMIEDVATADLVGCFRLLPQAGAQILHSYSAQFYDLTKLAGFDGPMLEMGRFCIHPDRSDPDILRMAWGFLTRWVDFHGVRLLFGCTSFAGDVARPHLDAFAQLLARHQAPDVWQPAPKVLDRFDFAAGLAGHRADPLRAQTSLPPLLRTYLLMGGWVSDHAVYDRDLHTMHVFTGVEIAAIPASRARLLRALAGGVAV